MADPLKAVPVSPYHAFQGSLPTVNFHQDELSQAFTDDNGIIFYETPYCELLNKIIELDDVATLQRYLAVDSNSAFIFDCGDAWDDPFGNAASHGSKECLAVLLKYWRSFGGPQQTLFTSPNARECGPLLHIACSAAEVETVMLLLSDPWRAEFGDVQASDRGHYTPLLCAAGSWDMSPRRPMTAKETVARSEETIRILLEHGASVGNTVVIEGAIYHTVLSNAVCGGPSQLVEQLIEEGADINARITKSSNFAGNDGNSIEVEEINLAHIASKYANLGALQLLLDKGNDLVRHVDGQGRTCLHYAAMGAGHVAKYMIEPEDIIRRVTDTTKLLFTADRERAPVNKQDSQQDTPLHYAARRRYGLPNGDIGLAVAQILCEHGADASIRGRNGQTPLHGLCSSMAESEPIEAAFINLLLAYGAGVGDVDKFGNTALHYTAGQLPQVDAVRYLLDRGADVRVVNAEGNTSLHEAAGGDVLINGLGFVTMHWGFTAVDNIRVQDAMLKALTQGLLPAEASSLLEQANKEGKTSRQICQEKRETWRLRDVDMTSRAKGICTR